MDVSWRKGQFLWVSFMWISFVLLLLCGWYRCFIIILVCYRFLASRLPGFICSWWVWCSMCIVLVLCHGIHSRNPQLRGFVMRLWIIGFSLINWMFVKGGLRCAGYTIVLWTAIALLCLSLALLHWICWHCLICRPVFNVGNIIYWLCNLI